MTVITRQVRFTVLEDGTYLPSIGAVLPEGSYAGRISERDGRVTEVVIVLQRKTLDAIGGAPRKPSLAFTITKDYLAGMISED